MPDERPIHERFSDEEMDLIKRYGHALGGNPTPFEDEVQRHLDAMDAADPDQLAAQRFREQGPPQMAQPGGPLPPQEAVNQPGPQKKKAGGASKPTGTTPAALGQKAVEPQEPQGDF